MLPNPVTMAGLSKLLKRPIKSIRVAVRLYNRSRRRLHSMPDKICEMSNDTCCRAKRCQEEITKTGKELQTMLSRSSS